MRASGFLMDMNVVFQEFVTTALREALGVSPRVFLEKSIPSLDEEGKVHLRPDLTWWQGGTCLFVGDAKYKRISATPRPERRPIPASSLRYSPRSPRWDAHLRPGRGGADRSRSQALR